MAMFDFSVCICIYLCSCAFMHLCIYARKCVFIHLKIYASMCVSLHLSIYISIYLCTNVYTYIYIYICDALTIWRAASAILQFWVHAPWRICSTPKKPYTSQLSSLSGLAESAHEQISGRFLMEPSLCRSLL